MAIMRINKTTDYTVMSNYHFREKGMSLKAKGLLSLMLSLPEDWDFTVKGLANLNKDGVDGVRAALEELKTFLVEGKSINWIASHYGCDWSTIRNRIYENPELVEVSS